MNDSITVNFIEALLTTEKNLDCIDLPFVSVQCSYNTNVQSTDYGFTVKKRKKTLYGSNMYCNCE